MAEWTINPLTKRWQQDGVDTEYQAVGQPGATPAIDSTTGDWFIDGHDTGVLARGTNGENGLSAYELAVKNGYPYSEDKWLASLKGEPGDDGKAAFSVKIGKATAGTEPAVTNSGTDTDLVLDFVLPDTQTIQWDNYTTTTDLDKKLNGKQDKQDMANYYDAKSVDKLLANKADLSTVANVPDKVDVQNLKTENQQLRDQVTTLSGQLLKVQSDVAAINAKLATLPAK